MSTESEDHHIMPTPIREARSTDWRAQRRSGVGAIVIATFVALCIGFVIIQYVSPIASTATLPERLSYAVKCLAVATLFCLVAGIEAVAHERLQSPAFDPLSGFETRRLLVNQRYLQNTLEQLVVFAVALLGLAVYLSAPQASQVMLALTIIWILGRFAFWIGYHRSAAARGLGAPGMMASILALIYVVWRVGNDVAGTAGGVGFAGSFLFLEAILFTRTRSEPAPPVASR